MRVEKVINTHYYLTEAEANKIREYLFKNKLSVLQLSRNLNVSYNYVFQLLAGKRPITKTIFEALKKLNDPQINRILNRCKTFDNVIENGESND